jgi:hypothetical protein
VVVLPGIGRFYATGAVLVCTDQNLAGCGPAPRYQQYLFVNDSNGRVACFAGAGNTANLF